MGSRLGDAGKRVVAGQVAAKQVAFAVLANLGPYTSYDGTNSIGERLCYLVIQLNLGYALQTNRKKIVW